MTSTKLNFKLFCKIYSYNVVFAQAIEIGWNRKHCRCRWFPRLCYWRHTSSEPGICGESQGLGSFARSCDS